MTASEPQMEISCGMRAGSASADCSAAGAAAEPDGCSGMRIASCLPSGSFAGLPSIFPPPGERVHAGRGHLMITKIRGSHWTHDLSGSWTVLARGGDSADIVPNVDSDAGGRAADQAVGAPQVRRFSSGTTWEPVVGYSRAVAAGDFVFVSGCTSVAGAQFVHPGDAYAQTRQAIGNAADGLTGLGASLADVVQTRMYVTD